MNAADQAIEEIRAARHRISAAHGHDITKHLASLRVEEQQHPTQLQRGEALLARRKMERRQYPAPAAAAMVLREHPES
jgi:hypothetical protein